MPDNHVIVIGAGIGGLVAALELSSRGIATTILERAAQPGGKMRETQIGAHRLDAGPTVFTMRRVFDEIFSNAGTTLDAELTVRPVETLARHAWDDSRHFDLFADKDRSVDAISTLAGPAEGRRYLEFCDRANRIFKTLDGPFMRAAGPSMPRLISSAGISGLPALIDLKPFSTLWRELGKHFHDPRLQQLFGRYATYCGSSPFQASATLMLVAHVEQSGVWIIEGGMYRLAEALSRLAQAKGAVMRCGVEAKEMMIERGRITGVVTDGGERIPADSVIVNADAAALANGLLGTGSTRAVSAKPGARSLSAVTWSLVAEASGFPLIRHNVFFGRDYAAEFDAIFKRNALPHDPTIYVCAHDRSDTAVNAPGPERLLCLANAPATGDTHAFGAEEIERYEQRAFDVLRRCGLEVVRTPEHSVVTTPTDFEQLFPGTGGALYGAPTHGWRAAFERSGPRSRVPGLYLAGGSYHPGPGVPMAAQSGRMAADCLLTDLASG